MARDGMKKTNLDDNTGVRLLLKKYRKMFRIRENLDFYSEEDYKLAEKKFLKYSLLGKIKY
jgi:hypothetical protein